MSEFRPRLRARAPKESKVPVPVVVVKPKRRKRKRKPRIGQLLKPKLMVKLRYVDTITIDPATTATLSHVFRANSIFKPDLTDTGHQPLLHDTYALLYERYRVVSSTIKVTPVAVSGTLVVPGFWGVFGDEDASLNYTLATAIMEDSTRTGGQVRMHLAGAAQLQGDSPLLRPITATFNAKKNLAPDGAMDSTAFGSSPSDAETTYKWHVWAGAILANDVGDLPFLIEIEYICELSDPIVIAQS